MNEMFEEMKKRSEQSNKRFKRDLYFFIFMLSWGVPLAAWCIAQVINGCCG